MKQHLKTVLSLTIICAVVAVLLALTNSITAPIIAKQESSATQGALKEVLPSGEDFKEIDLSKYKFPATVIEAYSEKNGGCVFKLETTGYSSGLVIMCGISPDGTVAGAVCIASQETNNAEKTYGEKVKGKSAENIDTVDTVSGSTLTSTAYRNAVKDALNAFKIFGGEAVDIRTDAEILAEGLNTALPEAKGNFTVYYMKDNVSVYEGADNTGYVFRVNDVFIPTDINGNILTEPDEATFNTVSALTNNILETKLTAIDKTKYPSIKSAVEEIRKTPDGGYRFKLRAEGYGILGKSDKWHPTSGEFIKITAFVSANGEILSCVTTAEGETENVGSICATPEFYTQFNGKNEGNYNEIDAISGATITTDGYKAAINIMFETIKILKGEVL